MRRIASLMFIALATFGAGSTAAQASPLTSSPGRGTIALHRANGPVGSTGRGVLTATITAWHPKGSACIICWNQGR